MAKSARASVTKRNHANLRATVFGPADNARTERLSAKLQELASRPNNEEKDKHNMDLDGTGAGEQKEPLEDRAPKRSEEMDIDKGSAIGKHKRTSGRIHKRHSNRKNRSSIVFRPRQSKGNRVTKKK